MRINDFQAFDAGEILLVIGNQCIAMSQGSGGNNGIGRFYFFALAQVYALRDHTGADAQNHAVLFA